MSEVIQEPIVETRGAVMASTEDITRSTIKGAIDSWFGCGPEAVTEIDDKYIEEVQSEFPFLQTVNKIGLKRHLGNYLKEHGYTKTCSNPPTWVLLPEKREDIPIPIQDAYRSFLCIGRAVSMGKEELIKLYPSIDAEARR